MLRDIGAVIWKEWRELLTRTSRTASDIMKTLIVGGVILGIIVWRSSFIGSNLGALLIPSFGLVQLLGGIMADSFAGERERHTLETLLATRLSDLAILIGKIVAGVVLAWGLLTLTLLLAIVSAYVRNGDGRLPVSASELAVILTLYLLTCVVVACAAVLVSLRAATVRQALQTLTWCFMGVFFLAILIVGRLSASSRASVLRLFAGDHLLQTEIIGVASLVALAAVLFSAARLRFQRARLILP
jgi:ABC-2 type transport system permease protein